MAAARAANADETPDIGGWLKLPEGPGSKRQDHFKDGAAKAKPYEHEALDEAWSKHFHAWSGQEFG